MPLTRQILARTTPETRVVVLENHGLIVCGADVAATAALMEEVEARLHVPVRDTDRATPAASTPDGFDWASESWIARDARACRLARAGSYYPGHVVFLGPALPGSDHDGTPPAILVDGVGIALRTSPTASQRAMLRRLSDLLARLPDDWPPRADRLLGRSRASGLGRR